MSGYVGLYPPRNQRRGVTGSRGRAQNLQAENADLVVGLVAFIVPNNLILPVFRK